MSQYYEPLGVDISIKFESLTTKEIDAISRFFRIAKSDFSPDHLTNQETPVPVITISKDGKIISVPLVGSDDNVHAPMRDPKSRQMIGSFLGIQIVHSPELGSTLTSNISFIIHEIDHAVRAVLPYNKDVHNAEDRIVSEGSAELARDTFASIQNDHNSQFGWELSNMLMLAIATVSEGENVRENLKHTYASGLLLCRAIRKVMGSRMLPLLYNQDAIGSKELQTLREKGGVIVNEQKRRAQEILDIYLT